MSPAASFTFAGQSFQMLADRALFWPRHGALIVADLHLEKASWYAALGQHLPPYDSHDTLDRLARLVAETGARAVWCLGDSFHDRDAASRIAPAVAQRLRSLAAATGLLWIAGNHDGLTGGAWGGTIADEHVVDGIVFRHQSVRADKRSEISGHFHPKLRTNVRGRHVSRPCFVGDAQRLILPAFGSLTGGIAADAPPIAENFAGAYQAMLVARGRRLCFPCPGPVRDDATASKVPRADAASQGAA
jgi:DNA ligase-associated metallophosphoesterase